MSELHYSRTWWVVGCAWVLLVIYLSVANIRLPEVNQSFGDKVNHALAYGFLMGWFGQLLESRRWYLLAIALVLLGVLMELIQSVLPYRSFGFADALANTAGVLVALLLLRVGGNRLLRYFERWVKP